MATAVPPYALPIGSRPPPKGSTFLRTLGFALVFDVAILCIHGTQYLVWPLKFINKRLFERGNRWIKGGFGVLMVLTCQWFAPTQFVITTEGMDDSMIVKDAAGKVVGLQLPEKLVMMSNHQVYLDWWYLWAFTYFLNMHAYVIIMLKKSLKWVPVVGWGMQFFGFIFMARSWVADRLILKKELTRLGEQTQKRDSPLFLMIFPEGTLVSKDTRPLSKKYADKVGLDDLTHTLLPRSTGLHFSLRALAPYIPSLHLLDITIGYPGVPPAGFGQAYYTIRSVFFQSTPPPAVHLHLRIYQVQRDVPIGHVRPGGHGQIESTDSEKTIFDKWLTDRWREKDRLMDGFYRDGKFTSSESKPKESSAKTEVGSISSAFGDIKATNGNGNGHVMKGDEAMVIPIETRSAVDVLDAFCYGFPGWLLWAFIKARRSMRG
ncbi:hypothetical protein FRB95_007388 [Tulasnella sp. JGI-2019a]|nr:hypothetical protein FRB95_007388 [Tulasnella sp. JGI-2019a]